MRDAPGLFRKLQVNDPDPATKFVKLAGPMGFEPTTSDVTGRRSNRAELRPRCERFFYRFRWFYTTSSVAGGSLSIGVASEVVDLDMILQRCFKKAAVPSVRVYGLLPSRHRAKVAFR
jgi:hypothetical protein